MCSYSILCMFLYVLFSYISIIIFTTNASGSTSSSLSLSLKVGFYQSTCPSAEDIVWEVVNNAIQKNPRLGASLIRLHFHDCFVRGCDASILLDSSPENQAEKDNPINNPSTQGYEVIDEAKTKLEAECPETVSCADIIAIAARDSIKLAGIDYATELGRRDGRISLKTDPDTNLPTPFSNSQQLQQSFESKGLFLEEMVTLSGAHSIGMSHCSSFANRLYSFNATNPQDPSLDPKYAEVLKSQCPNVPYGGANIGPTVSNDFVTPNKLDNLYYQNLENGKVLLTSDQSLMTNTDMAVLVGLFSVRGGDWADRFVRAMIHMGSIEVLTGVDGEIRKNCRVVN